MGVKLVRDALRPVWAERIDRWKRATPLRITAGAGVVVLAAVILSRYVEMDTATAAEWSMLAEWLAAAATVLAVVAALRIATNDRHDRAADAARASEAQARLVRATVTFDPTRPLHLAVEIDNYGQSAVLQVMLHDVHVRVGDRHYVLSNAKPSWLPVVPPVHLPKPSTGCTFLITMKDADTGTPWRATAMPKLAENSSATVDCLDANGSWWRVHSDHGPERIRVAKQTRQPLRRQLQSKISGAWALIKMLFTPERSEPEPKPANPDASTRRGE